MKTKISLAFWICSASFLHIVLTNPILYSRKDGKSEDLQVLTVNGSQDCEYNGVIYQNGDRIKSKEPCEDCYCVTGEVTCSVIGCAPLKEGCIATPVEGKCCPVYECDAEEGGSEEKEAANELTPDNSDTRVFEGETATTVPGTQLDVSHTKIEEENEESITSVPDTRTDETMATVVSDLNTDEDEEPIVSVPDTKTDEDDEPFTSAPDTRTDEEIATNAPDSQTDDADEPNTSAPDTRTDEEIATNVPDSQTDEADEPITSAPDTRTDEEIATNAPDSRTDEADEPITNAPDSRTDEEIATSSPESGTDEKEESNTSASDTRMEEETTTAISDFRMDEIEELSTSPPDTRVEEEIGTTISDRRDSEDADAITIAPNTGNDEAKINNVDSRLRNADAKINEEKTELSSDNLLFPDEVTEETREDVTSVPIFKESKTDKPEQTDETATVRVGIDAEGNSLSETQNQTEEKLEEEYWRTILNDRTDESENKDVETETIKPETKKNENFEDNHEISNVSDSTETENAKITAGSSSTDTVQFRFEDNIPIIINGKIDSISSDNKMWQAKSKDQERNDPETLTESSDHELETTEKPKDKDSDSVKKDENGGYWINMMLGQSNPINTLQEIEKEAASESSKIKDIPIEDQTVTETSNAETSDDQSINENQTENVASSNEFSNVRSNLEITEQEEFTVTETYQKYTKEKEEVIENESETSAPETKISEDLTTTGEIQSEEEDESNDVETKNSQKEKVTISPDFEKLQSKIRDQSVPNKEISDVDDTTAFTTEGFNSEEIEGQRDSVKEIEITTESENTNALRLDDEAILDGEEYNEQETTTTQKSIAEEQSNPEPTLIKDNAKTGDENIEQDIPKEEAKPSQEETLNEEEKPIQLLSSESTVDKKVDSKLNKIISNENKDEHVDISKQPEVYETTKEETEETGSQKTVTETNENIDHEAEEPIVSKNKEDEIEVKKSDQEQITDNETDDEADSTSTTPTKHTNSISGQSNPEVKIENNEIKIEKIEKKYTKTSGDKDSEATEENESSNKSKFIPKVEGVERIADQVAHLARKYGLRPLTRRTFREDIKQRRMTRNQNRNAFYRRQ